MFKIVRASNIKFGKHCIIRIYSLFLDLEGEMFQLNYILTEQKNLMEEVITMFATKATDINRFLLILNAILHDIFL